MKNLKKKRIRILAAALASCVLVPAALVHVWKAASDFNEELVREEQLELAEEERKKEEYVAKEVPVETVREDKHVYDGDDETSVVTMYLTVREGNEADNTNHTWSEINEHSAYYYDENGLDRFNCEAVLQVGDENGPVEGEFGYGEEAANAAVQVRGQTSSREEQKNYKIRIKPGKGSWRGQRTIALNKHVGNALRFSNKFAYDFIKEVPQMIGARTQFVHLYVKDETDGGNGEFTDYGLYTQVEQLNKTYLKNHGLDNRGQFYKVNFFEWLQYEAIRPSEDPEYDLKDFEKYLEVKGNDDHTKLISMLEQLNDYSVPMKEIVERHFDVENLCYWAAFQMLIGNYDTGVRNLYLYSPQSSEKWYLVSWDNDVAFSRLAHERQMYTEGESWECGMTQFVVTVLFRRLFREEEYREALDAAVNDLMENYLTREKVEKRVSDYGNIVKQYLFSEPDSRYGSVRTLEEYELLADSVYPEIEENYARYKESLQKPWPFFVGMPVVEDGELSVSWDAAYDLDGERITYRVILARDYEFTDVVFRADGLWIPNVSFGAPEAGEYYLRVQAVNESGYVQECFDYIAVDGVGKVYGTYAFSIDERGKVSIPAVEAL